jgi:hypothetical protein
VIDWVDGAGGDVSGVHQNEENETQIFPLLRLSNIQDRQLLNELLKRHQADAISRPNNSLFAFIHQRKQESSRRCGGAAEARTHGVNSYALLSVYIIATPPPCEIFDRDW